MSDDMNHWAWGIEANQGRNMDRYDPTEEAYLRFTGFSEEDAPPLLYLLVCHECGDGGALSGVVMPFESAQARGQWGIAHTRATGHESWSVRDEAR